VAFRSTALQAELQADPAALKARLELLYREHRVDAKVAEVLDVHVNTLKRALEKLGELGHAPEIERRRGRRWNRPTGENVGMV
jgi:sugar diacid utilization regulator